MNNNDLHNYLSLLMVMFGPNEREELKNVFGIKGFHISFLVSFHSFDNNELHYYFHLWLSSVSNKKRSQRNCFYELTLTKTVSHLPKWFLSVTVLRYLRYKVGSYRSNIKTFLELIFFIYRALCT